ncbi:DUF177 domain-containing protein [Sphingomonas sp. S1-29]|uniref:YceD family protein n=1 Tax=Sphingomonas sp. S1-29 TaxID=2991074 RepID=UPI00223EFBC7|nr:YceD family protein [Sphingomonas sp. S1-29]UZK69091.1 DUF177 domain-containing protein [Sphingomonas sp. S1-29]
MTPEFSRPHRLDQIGTGENRIHIEASDTERAALARRFDLQAIDRLVADYALRRDAAGVIVATGTLEGAVIQSCIASAAPVPASIAESFTIRFLPTPDADTPDEVELDSDDCDTVFYSGGAVDLGDAAAETLALALDPFPRSPAAEAALREAGVLREEELRPVTGLSGLADLLKKG